MAASAKIVSEIAAALPAPEPAATSEQVTQRREGDTLEARSTSRRIKTVEDLLAHIEADLDPVRGGGVRGDEVGGRH
jgi:hypothetical protein